MSRTYNDELQFLEKINKNCWRIKKGFVPNMQVEGVFYVNDALEKLMFEELRNACRGGGVGGFLPAMKQIGNVAALPGIVHRSIGLPDVHSGYGFAIGNMAAFDMNDPEAVVSPGGVGFDINCGVRLLRTNLDESDVQPVKEQLAQAMFDHIPVGVGSKGVIPMNAKDLEEALEMGVDWSLREGYAWAEDKEHCEEYGRMLQADPNKVSARAKKRGLPQLGTLGAGNHYAEIQVVDEIFNEYAAKKMGIDHKGQVCVMIHSGSRGLGHQVATDALVAMEKAMKRDKIIVNDRQLACARIASAEGQDYLKGMAAAGNYAWVNRSSMTFLTRGVGFDINCGVRLLRTNLDESDVQPVKEQLAQAMFDHIPVGVGSKGVIPMNAKDLEEALEMGVDWSLREGYAWAEDKEHCEEYGRMLQADPNKVSARAKKRGLPQLGTLGAGNHYAEIQVVDEIFNEYAAKKMGIDHKGQVCVMIHSGSRGLGHQVATDALVAMEKAMKRDKIIVNDRQLACARIASAEGQDYLKGMAAAGNYAWVNRSSMTFLTRQAFAKVFNTTPDDLDLHVIYDVSHNIAKVEQHVVDGKERTLLVHRKGSTRAFPPHHPLIAVDYQLTGQPVLIGGTMGTCSYVLTGTEQGMTETFGTTCHGAGRALSRAKSRRNLDFQDVLDKLADMGIAIRVASPKLVMEEAPESYKNVTDVVNTCHDAGISKKAIKLRPIAVIKG
ncbi:Hypothetical predicted protein [Marmota monax]|uniref:RNA-splicing ligase RtcB homolog n=1 Tax=Marmota monax TaxID=9995 RepID=A0A5E4A491_MARMO|nr:Hypothetical predicted protein [Marmota monax]